MSPIPCRFKHNRGCAVDLTIYDLKTGKPVAMPSGYDEFTERASPNYAGGTETDAPIAISCER